MTKTKTELQSLHAHNNYKFQCKECMAKNCNVEFYDEFRADCICLKCGNEWKDVLLNLDDEIVPEISHLIKDTEMHDNDCGLMYFSDCARAMYCCDIVVSFNVERICNNEENYIVCVRVCDENPGGYLSESFQFLWKKGEENKEIDQFVYDVIADYHNEWLKDNFGEKVFDKIKNKE